MMIDESWGATQTYMHSDTYIHTWMMIMYDDMMLYSICICGPTYNSIMYDHYIIRWQLTLRQCFIVQSVWCGLASHVCSMVQYGGVV